MSPWLGLTVFPSTGSGAKTIDITDSEAGLYNNITGHITSVDAGPGGNTTADILPKPPIDQHDLDALFLKKGWKGAKSKDVNGTIKALSGCWSVRLSL